MDKTTYIFFHITKTAGTSLRSMLFHHHFQGWHSKYDQNIIYPYYNGYMGVKNSRPLILNWRTEHVRYFIGHLVYYGMHEVLNRPCEYILFLRDPINRYCSLFNHLRAENNDGKPYTFDTFISVCKSYSMVEEITSGSKYYGKSLDGAKEILKNVSFIGFQETFEKDIKELLGSNATILTLNTRRTRADKRSIEPVEFTEEEVKMVTEKAKEDIEFYNYAKELVDGGYNRSLKSILER